MNNRLGNRRRIAADVLAVIASVAVTKPFGRDELLARLRAVLRRAVENGTEPRVMIGDLIVDLEARRVSSGGAEVHLTPIEFDLLRVLTQHRGKLVTHAQLCARSGGRCTRARPTTCGSTSPTSARRSSPSPRDPAI